MSQDVAGASVMAAAVACPELFVNILATFFTEGDVGVGTVVGTGLFNILLVPGLCILMADQKVYIFFKYSLCPMGYAQPYILNSNTSIRYILIYTI